MGTGNPMDTPAPKSAPAPVRSKSDEDEPTK
jgi:hypothetical protein